MKVLDAGHHYLVNNLDADRWMQQAIIFVKREGELYPGNIGHHPGTNCQEVIRVLIDRFQYLNNQERHTANERAVIMLREILWNLEDRAASRHGLPPANFTGEPIEKMPVCLHCGHIVCATPQWDYQ